ncbi:Thioesterase/thiol ester dehydrase-isomerase [Gonapodya prolifera JEL478]|uniref:Thioesterase/thiol ester dehydrase-isomerase n=1 Tax=Gonapodya prolifera (strain JEL478) TaxID=1344416 RepID=A0A139ANU4_GONPJ|nr:Thioesterase/thiol ester dehydrase-isomerase [Gonapodya prolifera JEL478]|eukprot:KXS18421.1 Thioesterase/thiol ester dehydrase-isomerase [Gonapodya prolifera JEL478]
MSATPPPPLKPAPFTGDASITQHVQKYVGVWSEGVGYGYDVAMFSDGVVKVIAAEKGRVHAQMVVEKRHLNVYGTLHGGLIATLIDNVTTFAIISHADGTDKLDTTNSVELSVGYLKGVNLGDTLDLYGYCPKAGRTLAFTSCDIFVKDTLVAQGRHTKFVFPPTPGGLAKAVEDRKRKEGML